MPCPQIESSKLQTDFKIFFKWKIMRTPQSSQTRKTLQETIRPKMSKNRVAWYAAIYPPSGNLVYSNFTSVLICPSSVLFSKDSIPRLERGSLGDGRGRSSSCSPSDGVCFNRNTHKYSQDPTSHTRLNNSTGWHFIWILKTIQAVSNIRFWVLPALSGRLKKFLPAHTTSHLPRLKWYIKIYC